MCYTINMNLVKTFSKIDWYLTNEFVNWAEAHGIDPKIVLTCKVERH